MAMATCSNPWCPGCSELVATQQSAYGLYALVVPRGRVHCQHPATRVPSAASRGRFKFIAESETVSGRLSRQSDDAYFARRVGQAERVPNGLPREGQCADTRRI